METHLVITEAAEKTILMETDWKVEEVKSLAKVVYDIKDLGADIASGSFHFGRNGDHPLFNQKPLRQLPTLSM